MMTGSMGNRERKSAAGGDNISPIITVGMMVSVR